MEDLRVFNSLELAWLDKDWVDSVWDSDFTLHSPPPEEYETFVANENVGLQLKECCTVAKTWLAANNNEYVESTHADVSWETLTNMKINVRGLLPVLGYIMKDGQHDYANIDSQSLCLKATHLYLIFLIVPGSDAFNIFSSNLYQRALESLKLVKSLLPQTNKQTESCSNFSKSKHLWKSSLLKQLHDVMSTLLQVSQSFRFRDHGKCLNSTIKILSEITVLETDVSLSDLENRMNVPTIASFCYNLHLIFESLCHYRHGSTDITIMLIAKHSLPWLTVNASNSQTPVNARDALINLLKRLSISYENEANAAVLTLFQNLMTQCPERLEVRQKQAIVIIKLINISNGNTLLKAVKELILFSHNAKVACRLFAQEIIGKLLSDISSMPDNLVQEKMINIRQILVATILSRCNDRSNMVRSKAMGIMADYSEATENVNTIFNNSESSSSTEELPSIDRLIEALESDNSNPLPGACTVLKILLDRIEDERALVRRNALQILKNMVSECPSSLQNIAQKIGERCRDPSLTVRRFAVQILTNLLERYADNADILDEWVRTIMPQVFDIEVKVQEKMLESFRDLLLTRITRVTDTINNQQRDVANDLPWQLLQKITSTKMRKHLAKACHLWVKNGMITKSMITNVQSHIGTKNDISAWVLLAAIAESQPLPDMQKYVKDYKELIRKNDFQASLALEVLRSSFSSMDKAVLEDLYLYLSNSICLFDIDFGLISLCIDVIHSVAKHLDCTNGEETREKGIPELMDLAEAEIQKFLEGKDRIVAVAPTFLKAMSTLGHTAILCPHKNVQSSTLRILQGLILEYHALPDLLKEIKELRASAVVLLAQLAMRDREVAQEVIPIFGRLVRQNSSSDINVEVVLKVNAIKALADLCVRHTALVEPYLTDMCISMKDPNPVLREVVVVIFIQLLLEDFIKVNGPFFYHILTVLSDEEKTIRDLTVFLIEERLLTKNKTLVSQRFLESLYHYNNYQIRRAYSYERRTREKERKFLTLPGHINEDKRRIIYDFMLQHLDPPGKLRLIVKLTSQIFGGVCDDTINVTCEEGSCVLKDAFYIMGNHRLRPSVTSEKTGDDTADDEPIDTRISNAVKIIVDSTKKHSLDVLLPILTKLWKKLTALDSSLKNEVKSLLLKSLGEYDKNQLSSLFNEYPELEKEMNESRSNENESENCSSSEVNILSSTGISLAAVREACLKSSPKVVLRRISLSDYPVNFPPCLNEMSLGMRGSSIISSKSENQLFSSHQAITHRSTTSTSSSDTFELSSNLSSPRSAKMKCMISKYSHVQKNLT